MPEAWPPEAQEASPPEPVAPDHVKAQPERPFERRTRDSLRRDAVLAAAFAVAALALYMPGIAHPGVIVFDEAHYVGVARQHVDGVFINHTWGERSMPVNYEHPPLAKYLMWASVEVLGDHPAAWRLPSVMAAAAGVAGAYLLGRRLFDDEAAGVAAAGLLLADHMFYLHAGLAMLEVFPAAFTLWAFALALGPDREARVSALVYGCAVSMKYNALFLLPVFFLVHWLRTPYWSAKGRVARATAWSLGVPFAVLVFTYLPFFLIWFQELGPGQTLIQWVLVQVAAVSWDFGAEATHPYSSHPASWIPMVRPVHYYFLDVDGRTGHLYSMGNPALWWPAAALVLAALVLLPWDALRRHGRRLKDTALWLGIPRLRVDWTPRARLGLAVALVLAAYLPYFLLRRIVFLYYMTGIVPFLALALAGPLAWAWRRGGRWRVAVGAYGALVAAAFVFYLPMAEGFLVPRGWFEAIFDSIPWMRK